MPPVGDIRRGMWGRGELRETLGTGDLGEGRELVICHCLLDGDLRKKYINDKIHVHDKLITLHMYSNEWK